MAKNTAFVRPEMLKWAREDANMSLETAAEQTHFPVKNLKKWESGDAAPTVRQAHILAKVYDQPFAVFYLPRPPQIKRSKVHDYRKLPKASQGHVSSELTLEIRRAYERREIALELYEERKELPLEFTLSANLKDDPSDIGMVIRENLGIDYDKQSTWRSADVAFRNWREAIEGLGILVFQTEDVSIKEVRGFSITDLPLPVIVVNKKDFPQAKIFTMFHELTHIMLRSSGMCDPVGLYNRSKQTGDYLEIFCNRVAAETLIPKQSFMTERLVLQIKQGQNWGDKDVVNLARTYNTSREAILRRLLTFGLITSEFYRQKRTEYQKQLASLPKKKGGQVHPVVMSISTNGRSFTKLVVNAFYTSHITSYDLSNYLGIKLAHLKRISDAVGVGS